MFLKQFLIFTVLINLCFCPDGSARDIEGFFSSTDVTGTWTVVATNSEKINLPQARCWTVTILSQSATSCNGSSSYVDDVTTKRLNGSFSAMDLFLVNIVFKYDIPDAKMTLLEAKPTVLTPNLLECSITVHNSDGWCRVILSRTPTLSEDDERLLKSRAIKLNVPIDDCTPPPVTTLKPHEVIITTEKTPRIWDSEVWNVVAVLSESITIPQVCDWTFNVSRSSAALDYNGTSTYLDEGSNEIVNVRFGAHATDIAHFSVFTLYNNSYQFFEASRIELSPTTVEWLIHDGDNSNRSARIFVSRSSILSSSDEAFLHALGVINFIKTDCLWPSTSTPDETILSSSTLATTSPSSADATTVLSIGDITGIWRVFAINTPHCDIPKARCWTIKISKISPMLYESTATYFDRETNLKRTISTDAHATADGFFFGVSILPDNSIQYVKVPGKNVRWNLMKWTIHKSFNSQLCGQLYVSRNRTLTTAEQKILARERIKHYIDSKDCSLYPIGRIELQKEGNKSSMHPSPNFICLCICLWYAVILAFPSGQLH